MASTKKLTPVERKRAKRTARRELKKLQGGLTLKQRAEFRKSAKGLKAFVAEQAKAESNG